LPECGLRQKQAKRHRSIKEEGHYDGIEVLGDFFPDSMSSIFDYVPSLSVFHNDEPAAIEKGSEFRVLVQII
jgi:hypothetical protein